MQGNSEPLILPEPFQPSPELRLVAACSWLPNSGSAVSQHSAITFLTQSGLNWDDILSLVQRHDIAGQFCMVMGKLGWPNVPQETSERLKNDRTAQAARTLGQVAELARVGANFTEAGVALIPLKGVTLSQQLYGNPCIRNSCDLDILVKSEDVSRCDKLLTRLGYRHALGIHTMNERQQRHIIETTYHHEYVNDARGICIELHWRSNRWTKEQVTALWTSSEPFPWLNCGLRRLSPEMTLLFLMDHGARHCWTSLKWLSDVAMLVDKLSEEGWNSLLRQALFFDLQRVVAQTATLLQWFYAINVPQRIHEHAKADAIVRTIAKHAASRLLAAHNSGSFLEKKFPGISLALLVKKLKPATPLPALLGGSLITYDDFKDHPLPENLFWLYAFMRPFFWFNRHFMKR
jgi:hypothetical protein